MHWRILSYSAAALAVAAGMGTASVASSALVVLFPSPVTDRHLYDMAADIESHATNVGRNLFIQRPQIAAVLPVLMGAHRFVGVSAAPVSPVPGEPGFATLYVSTPIVVLGVEQGATHISTALWMHGEPAALGLLYTAPNGVEVGQLNAMPAAHAVLRSARNGWTLLEIDGYVAATVVVDSLDSAWLAAEFSYDLSCADCHQLHAPEEYSSMQWDMIMTRMAKFAKLDVDDARVILKWLQTTSSASDARR
jgi:hypothetical protein